MVALWPARGLDGSERLSVAVVGSEPLWVVVQKDQLPLLQPFQLDSVPNIRSSLDLVVHLAFSEGYRPWLALWVGDGGKDAGQARTRRVERVTYTTVTPCREARVSDQRGASDHTLPLAFTSEIHYGTYSAGLRLDRCFRRRLNTKTHHRRERAPDTATSRLQRIACRAATI